MTQRLLPLPGRPGSLPSAEWALLAISSVSQTNTDPRGYDDLDPRDAAPEQRDAAVNTHLLAAIDSLSTLVLREPMPAEARPWYERTLPVLHDLHARLNAHLVDLDTNDVAEIDGTAELTMLLLGVRAALQAGIVLWEPSSPEL